MRAGRDEYETKPVELPAAALDDGIPAGTGGVPMTSGRPVPVSPGPRRPGRIPFSGRLRPGGPRRNTAVRDNSALLKLFEFYKDDGGGSDVPRIPDDGVRHLDG